MGAAPHLFSRTAPLKSASVSALFDTEGQKAMRKQYEQQQHDQRGTRASVPHLSPGQATAASGMDKLLALFTERPADYAKQLQDITQAHGANGATVAKQLHNIVMRQLTASLQPPKTAALQSSLIQRGMKDMPSDVFSDALSADDPVQHVMAHGIPGSSIGAYIRQLGAGDYATGAKNIESHLLGRRRPGERSFHDALSEAITQRLQQHKQERSMTMLSSLGALLSGGLSMLNQARQTQASPANDYRTMAMQAAGAPKTANEYERFGVDLVGKGPGGQPMRGTFDPTATADKKMFHAQLTRLAPHLLSMPVDDPSFQHAIKQQLRHPILQALGAVTNPFKTLKGMVLDYSGKAQRTLSDIAGRMQGASAPGTSDPVSDQLMQHARTGGSDADWRKNLRRAARARLSQLAGGRGHSGAVAQHLMQSMLAQPSGAPGDFGAAASEGLSPGASDKVLPDPQQKPQLPIGWNDVLKLMAMSKAMQGIGMGGGGRTIQVTT